jgi:hypothetical protein
MKLVNDHHQFKKHTHIPLVPFGAVGEFKVPAWMSKNTKEVNWDLAMVVGCGGYGVSRPLPLTKMEDI